MNVNITALSSTNATLGWQPSPQTRGTWDILWNCMQTVALCAWVSVCANIPAPTGGLWDLFTDKFFFLLLTLLGPEFVFLLAYGQYVSASSSIALFKELGHDDWTLTHGFYADMGGVHVQPKAQPKGTFPSFPVNAKQIHYLVKHGHMQYPHMKRDDLIGLGKVDGLGRLVTAMQATYFLVNIAVRFGTGLAVTTMELTVMANVIGTLATFTLWWHKPTDVQVSQVFALETDIETVIRMAPEDAAGQYRETPLDFVSRDDWAGSLLWNYYVNILRRLNLLAVFNLHYSRPASRINSFNFPKPGTRRHLLIILVCGMVYISLFYIAWNFQFPTTIERTLWRITAVVQSSIVVCGSVFEIAYFDIAPAKAKDKRKQPLQRRDNGIASVEKSHYKASQALKSVRDLWDMPCNNELTGNFPFLDVPFRSILVTTPICALYVICRWYILAEDIIELRSLPASAYQEASLTPYWPQL